MHVVNFFSGQSHKEKESIYIKTRKLLKLNIYYINLNVTDAVLKGSPLSFFGYDCFVIMISFIDSYCEILRNLS